MSQNREQSEVKEEITLYFLESFLLTCSIYGGTEGLYR